MATYTLNAGDLAAHEKTLVASTVDTVQFASAVAEVEIVFIAGTDPIYVTLDGADPTVAGARTLVLPDVVGTARRFKVGRREAPTTVKLISIGTPTYSVALPWPGIGTPVAA